MTMTTDNPTRVEPRPLVVSRTFPVSREWVFRAWSSAEHLKRWFCPAGFSVPEAEVEFRPGGVFNICMRSPQGQDHWSRGHYVEIVPNTRLVIEMSVVGNDNQPLFHAHTVVTFADATCGSRNAAHEATTEQTARSVVHATFTVERVYDAPRARVFKALTDPAAKAKWFGGGAGYTLLAREMDARPGGREHVQGRWESGVVSTFDALYHDVVPNERIVYAYTMHLDERKISVSLATLELKPAGTGTRLVMTEQGAFLDGYDDAGSRERGTQFLLDALGRSLED
jgi:uncharacterized protein YndB with AHSA1/START domain